jgi:hypothetical protein
MKENLITENFMVKVLGFTLMEKNILVVLKIITPTD